MRINFFINKNFIGRNNIFLRNENFLIKKIL